MEENVPPGTSVALSDVSHLSSPRDTDGPSTSGVQSLREVRKARKVRKIVYEDSEEAESNDDQDINESKVMEIEEEGESEVDKEIKPETEEEGVSDVDKDIKPGSYCLVRFALKKSVVYYVGKIKGKSDDDVNDWEIDYYRKCENDSNGDYGYMLPQTPDEGLVSCDDVECVLQVKATYKNKIMFDKCEFPSTFMLK